MFEILQYGIMQRAFIAGIIIGIIAPMIGVYIVLRRLSMIGDTLAHVSLAGVAAGAIARVNPLLGAVIFTGFSSIGIEALRKAYGRYAELTLSIISAAGIGLATVLISMGKNVIGINNYLFGAIALTSKEDIVIIGTVGAVVFISILLLYRKLFYMTFDEEAAKLAGVSTRSINIYFSLLVAITIAVSMRIVGTLLISSLMTIPVAASLQVAKSFKQNMIYSVVFGLSSVIVGLTLSFYQDLAPGGTIILTAVAILIVVLMIKAITRRVSIRNSVS